MHPSPPLPTRPLPARFSLYQCLTHPLVPSQLLPQLPSPPQTFASVMSTQPSRRTLPHPRHSVTLHPTPPNFFQAKVAEISALIDRLAPLNPTPDPASSRLLRGRWDIVWTTEAELLVLTSKVASQLKPPIVYVGRGSLHIPPPTSTPSISSISSIPSAHPAGSPHLHRAPHTRTHPLTLHTLSQVLKRPPPLAPILPCLDSPAQPPPRLTLLAFPPSPILPYLTQSYALPHFPTA